MRPLSRRHLVPALVLGLALLSTGARARAQETPPPSPPAAAPEPAAAATPEPGPAPTGAAEKVLVSASVDVYYGYNFNGSDPTLRTFDVQHNAFSLSLAELALAKGVSPESRVGFRFDLGFGKSADIVASFEPEQDSQEVYKRIQQAYVSILAGSRFEIQAGKFVTPVGAEVIESQDNWNYTRSVLFGYAIPFYHAGVRGTFTASPKLAVSGFLVNGWNNSSGIQGDMPVVGLGVTLKPSERVSWVGHVLHGHETGAEAAPARSLFDTTLTIALSERLSLIGNLDYGREGDVRWWGIAAYARYQLKAPWALVGRYEYLDDTRGGFMTFGTILQTLTLTSDLTIAGALKARLECRGDFARAPVFSKRDGTLATSQTTLTVGLVYALGRSF